MANRRGYFERDRHGRERVVVERRNSYRRSSSHAASTRELLNDAEERNAVLSLENQTLRQQLSFEQSQTWEMRNLQTEYHRLRDEHHHCRHLRGQLEANVREVKRLEHKLDDEDDLNGKLSERLRLMKRGSGEMEAYRLKYEEKSAEVELLRRRLLEKDELVRLGEVRIASKDRMIAYLRGVLRDYGIRIEYHDR